jgi:TetR/AcrR family fatty acid metabolism transcriptional regulator
MSTTTGIRSLKERQRQEREELILQSAQALLLEKGYHEMAMEEIAARVGISKGTVYLHFPSKEDLVFALLLRSMHQFLDSIKEAPNCAVCWSIC